MSACAVRSNGRGRARDTLPSLCCVAWLAALATLLAACGGSSGARPPPSAAHSTTCTTCFGAAQHAEHRAARHAHRPRIAPATAARRGRWSPRDGQPMAGLMTFKLAQSPVDPKRVYCLGIPPRTGTGAPPPASGAAQPGLYTSDDAGQTWRLAAPATAFPSPSLYTIGAGSGGPAQVYAVVSSLGDPASSSAMMPARTGAGCPRCRRTPLPASPAIPPTLAASSSSAAPPASPSAPTAVRPGRSRPASPAASTPSRWPATPSTPAVTPASSSRVTAARTSPSPMARIPSPSSPPAPPPPPPLTPSLGTAVFRTTDAGQTWKQAAPTSQHPSLISVDPSNTATAYVGFSYPLGVAVTTDAGQSWRSVAH